MSGQVNFLIAYSSYHCCLRGIAVRTARGRWVVYAGYGSTQVTSESDCYGYRWQISYHASQADAAKALAMATAEQVERWRYLPSYAEVFA